MVLALNLVLAVALIGWTGGSGIRGPSQMGSCRMYYERGSNYLGDLDVFLLEDVVTIKGSLSRLPRNSYLGFHVHYLADHSKPIECVTGPDFNPFNKTHGCPGYKGQRHAGDLGNIKTTAGGFANIFIRIKLRNFVPRGKNGTEKAIVIHMGMDDCGEGGEPGTTIDGNSGPSLACCHLEFYPRPFQARSIESSVNGRCMAFDGNFVETHECENIENQMWELQPNNFGSYQLVSRENGKCVTFSSPHIKTEPCSNSKFQQWMIEPVKFSNKGEVYIKSQENQILYLTAEDDTSVMLNANGIRLYLTIMLQPDVEPTQQYWLIDPPLPAERGGSSPVQKITHGVLQNVYEGSCLHIQVKDTAKAQVAPLGLARCNFTDKYQHMDTGNWRKFSEKYGHLVFLATGYCLQEENGHTEREVNKQAACIGQGNNSTLYKISAGHYGRHFQLQSTTAKCLEPFKHEIRTGPCRSQEDAPEQFWTILPPPGEFDIID